MHANLAREIHARQLERESQPCRTRCRSMCSRSFARAASSRSSWLPSASWPSAGACSTPVPDGAMTRIGSDFEPSHFLLLRQARQMLQTRCKSSSALAEVFCRLRSLRRRLRLSTFRRRWSSRRLRRSGIFCTRRRSSCRIRRR